MKIDVYVSSSARKLAAIMTHIHEHTPTWGRRKSIHRANIKHSLKHKPTQHNQQRKWMTRMPVIIRDALETFSPPGVPTVIFILKCQYSLSEWALKKWMITAKGHQAGREKWQATVGQDLRDPVTESNHEFMTLYFWHNEIALWNWFIRFFYRFIIILIDHVWSIKTGIAFVLRTIKEASELIVEHRGTSKKNT